MNWDDLQPGVFAFTTDGVKVGEVGEVDPDRFEIRRENQRFWLPTTAASEITAGKLELNVSAEELARLLVPAR